ncbi:MAG: hypothetical protein U9O98_01295 [Asgard group archaeon]|nr:hypothetical protein [Asgard group archaeon]
MAPANKKRLELSPPLRDKIITSLRSIIAFTVGVIAICGAILVELKTMVQFATIFVGALTIFFSLYRILKVATVKLYIDKEEIHYRDRFVWKQVSWSDIISVGRENDIETKKNKGVIKRIKALIFLTKQGMETFEMSSYSLTSGLETYQKISNFDTEEREKEEEKIAEE